MFRKRGRGYRSPERFEPGRYGRADFGAVSGRFLAALPDALHIPATALIAMDAAGLTEEQREEFLRRLNSASQEEERRGA